MLVGASCEVVVWGVGWDAELGQGVSMAEVVEFG